jgi:hypothetical protein
MRLHRSVDEPVRTGLTTEERWKDPDRGLIACWERGREKAREDAAFAARARAGELLLLPWKGGVEKAIKGAKYGCLNYLAMWQGLRGDALEIDDEIEVEKTCSKHGARVIYTADFQKFAEP